MSEAEPEPEPEVEVTEGEAASAEGEVDAADGAERADGAAGDTFQRVQKNANGGVLVTDKEIEMAFRFFDPASKGKVDKEAVQARLAVFPEAAEHGLQDLKGLESSLTKKSLGKMLKNNKVTEFDPVAEAFKVLDPDGNGNVDMAVVREIFRGLGMGELTTDEINVIRKSGGNSSGYITLEDFRTMLDDKDAPPQ
jgi:Ca2+-binding EF-hand superfamily protein